MSAEELFGKIEYRREPVNHWGGTKSQMKTTGTLVISASTICLDEGVETFLSSSEQELEDKKIETSLRKYLYEGLMNEIISEIEQECRTEPNWQTKLSLMSLSVKMREKQAQICRPKA